MSVKRQIPEMKKPQQIQTNGGAAVAATDRLDAPAVDAVEGNRIPYGGGVEGNEAFSVGPGQLSFALQNFDNAA